MIENPELALRYPIFASVVDRQVVIIGGGEVAERKALTLLEYGALVRVISPELTDALELMAESGIVEHERREYEEGDLAQAFIAICACGVKAVNHRVYEEAQERNCLLNVVDEPVLCNFIAPSVVRRDPLQIAISTNGKAPAVAKRLKQELEGQFPQSLSFYIDLMGEVREIVKLRVGGGSKEHKPLMEALDASDLFSRIQSGVIPEAEDVFREYVVPQIKLRAQERAASEDTNAEHTAGDID